MIENKNIFVIILCYNSADETLELYHQVKRFYVGINVIVVDNNSLIIEKEKLQKRLTEDMLILNPVNLGYAGGNNIGINKSIELGAKYIWLLNPDIRLNKDTLSILIETMERDKNIAAIGPRICYRDEKDRIYSDGGVIIKEKGFFTTHINYNYKLTNNKINEVDYVNGSVFLINVTALKEIGLMLKGFFLYFEETEWCLRAKDMKYKLLVNTRARAYHKSSPKGNQYAYFMSRNRILLSKLRGEYYIKTLKIVGITLVNQLKKDIKSKKITKKTLFGIKGYINAVFSNVKKY